MTSAAEPMGRTGEDPKPALSGTGAIKFLSPIDFERGIDVVLDLGPVSALPNFVVVCNQEQIRRASREFVSLGVEFVTRDDLPALLTDEQSRGLGESEGWRRPNLGRARDERANVCSATHDAGPL